MVLKGGWSFKQLRLGEYFSDNSKKDSMSESHLPKLSRSYDNFQNRLQERTLSTLKTGKDQQPTGIASALGLSKGNSMMKVQ